VVAGLIIGVVMFIIFPFAGVLIVAMTPAVAIMGLARHVYGDQVTVGQMVVSFFETILWMLPLLLWDLIWFAIDKELNKDSGVCALCLLAYFLQAYFFAGFCEEFVKYLVIGTLFCAFDYVLLAIVVIGMYILYLIASSGRLTNSHLTQDWRAMMIYGICAGAGFATLENLMYVAQYGVATGVVRGFVSVPLHCTTAAIIGLNLANKRPIEISEGQSCIESNMIDTTCAYVKSKYLIYG
jgi:RsiW-degrading membrane proteinase PrsW (M82 family)